VGGEAISTPELEQLSKSMSYRYRQAKRNANIYVQKTRFAISSPQEKSEITAKGIATRRRSKNAFF
jgi:hypothetical protein